MSGTVWSASRGWNYKATFLYIYTLWNFYINLYVKRDHLMKITYLKAHPFRNRYLEWMPNLPSDRGQDSNPCTWESFEPVGARGSTVPRCPVVVFRLHHSMYPLPVSFRWQWQSTGPNQAEPRRGGQCGGHDLCS